MVRVEVGGEESWEQYTHLLERSSLNRRGWVGCVGGGAGLRQRCIMGAEASARGQTFFSQTVGAELHIPECTWWRHKANTSVLLTRRSETS